MIRSELGGDLLAEESHGNVTLVHHRSDNHMFKIEAADISALMWYLIELTGGEEVDHPSGLMAWWNDE